MKSIEHKLITIRRKGVYMLKYITGQLNMYDNLMNELVREDHPYS